MLPCNQIRRILVVKPSSLGDIFHTFPAIELLKRQLPGVRIDWLVHPAFAPALEFSPLPVSRTIIFERKRLGRVATLPAEFIRLAGDIRRRRYDLVIDFQGLFRSALFARLARGGRVVGFAAPRELPAKLLYRHRLPVDMGLHAIERNVNLVNRLLDRRDPVPEPELPRRIFRLPLAPETLSHPLMILVPGARWPSKRFPPRLFAEVYAQVRRRLPDCRGVIIGTAGEAELAREIIRLNDHDPQLIDLCGRTGMGEMLELIAAGTLVVSNDSGPAHAAAAFKVPVLGFFGPTDPRRTGLYFANRNRTFCRTDLDCLHCLARLCPGGSLRCHALDAAEVAATATEILRTAPPPEA